MAGLKRKTEDVTEGVQIRKKKSSEKSNDTKKSEKPKTASKDKNNDKKSKTDGKDLSKDKAKKTNGKSESGKLASSSSQKKTKQTNAVAKGKKEKSEKCSEESEDDGGVAINMDDDDDDNINDDESDAPNAEKGTGETNTSEAVDETKDASSKSTRFFPKTLPFVRAHILIPFLQRSRISCSAKSHGSIAKSC